jgi:phospholipid/cholesterol/gamma-HCH transport system substrate-binding protein
MSGFSTEAKVGLLVVIALAILGYMTIHLGIMRLGDDGYPLYVSMDSAGGLKTRAPVLMAGIQVGVVDKIELVDNRALLTLSIKPEVSLPRDSSAVLSTQGILGDTYVKLIPGSQQEQLAQGGQIEKVQPSARLDELTDSLGQILGDLKEITSSLKISLASSESQDNIQASLSNIREITDSLKLVIAGNEQRLVNVVQNLEKFTGDLSQLSGDNKLALSEIIKNFRNISGQLDHTMVALHSVVNKIDQGQGSLGALVNERQTVDELNAALASMGSITRKIDQGEGSLGKLVNDEQTVEHLDSALSGINDYLTRTDKWRLGLDYRGEWNFREQAMRNSLNIRLQPTADKFFLLGVVDDPRGQREDSYDRVVTTINGQTTVTERSSRHIDDDKLGFNAQFGKRFYDFSVRGGLFNSQGGVALDYYLFDDKLTLSLEASEFRRDERPRLRVAADYKFWRYFYITAGWDDFISQYNQDGFFLGAGISFYDDDLKYLFSSAPIP